MSTRGARDAPLSREELQASITSSNSVLLNELREMKRAQMEEHSRIKNLEDKVEQDLNVVQDMMGGVMTQVMDKIDSRLGNQGLRKPNGASGAMGKEPMSFAEMQPVNVNR
jgi:hypothetical protein